MSGQKDRHFIKAGMLLLVIGIFAVPCVAQGICSVKTFRLNKVEGRVVAQAREGVEPVANARIELRLKDENETLIQSAMTDREGHYEFQKVKPGTYWLLAEKELFSKYPVELKVVRRLRKGEESKLIVIRLGADPLEPCGGGNVEGVTASGRHNIGIQRTRKKALFLSSMFWARR